ncbi:leucine-rich repeat domain-containing protein, partial [archaeon]
MFVRRPEQARQQPKRPRCRQSRPAFSRLMCDDDPNFHRELAFRIELEEERMSSFSSITSSFSSSSALYRRGHELLALLSSLLVPENHTIQLRADLANYITETLFLLQKSLLKKYEDRIDFVLKELKRKVDEVRGMSVYCPPGPTQHPFAVNFYSTLEELWLYQCPPSTLIGLYSLRSKLMRLTIEYSGVCDMADVLTPVKQSLRSNLQPMILPEQAPTVPPKYQWSNLLVLRLTHCGIVRIDESLHFFPNLVSLDLSHNHIMHIAHLQDCIALENINLAYNRIRVLSNLERVLGKVKRLDVSHNEV